MRSLTDVRAAGALVLAALLSPAAAAAGTGHEHAEPVVLAPGYADLAFTPPAPGTYRLPPLGDAPDGVVLDRQGKLRRLHDLMGDGPVLLSFIYTTCSDVNGCPLATHVLAKTTAALGQDAKLASRVRLISLSFDPDNDTPEVMARYGEPFRGRGLDWRFLTTSGRAELDPILEGYDQWVIRDFDESGNALGTLSHLLRVYLIDRDKRIRNIYSVSFLHADAHSQQRHTHTRDGADGRRVIESTATMRRTFAISLLLALLAVFCFMISGFFGALVFAAAAALMFYPLQRWLENYLNPKAAAGVNLVLLFVAVIVPMFILLGLAAGQALAFVDQATTWLGTRLNGSAELFSVDLPDWLDIEAELATIREELTSRLGQIAGTVGRFVANTLSQVTRMTALFCWMCSSPATSSSTACSPASGWHGKWWKACRSENQTGRNFSRLARTSPDPCSRAWW